MLDITSIYLSHLSLLHDEAALSPYHPDIPRRQTKPLNSANFPKVAILRYFFVTRVRQVTDRKCHLKSPAVDDHGPFALGGLLSDRVYKLQDALCGICWRHTMIRPGCVVKMHHILRLVSL